MKIPVVLTCSVVFPWVRMPISSIHSLRLQCVGCAPYIRSSGAVPVSCFLLFALFSVFSSTSIISVSSVGRPLLFFFRHQLFFCFVVFWLFFRYYYFIYLFIYFSRFASLSIRPRTGLATACSVFSIFCFSVREYG